MNTAEIKEHVTHFSAQLAYTKQEEEVIVGGQITHIVLPIDDEEPVYVLILDDTIGTIHVFVPATMMDVYAQEVQVGNYVFMEGFVNIMTRQLPKEEKKDITIFAYKMKDITKEGHAMV